MLYSYGYAFLGGSMRGLMASCGHGVTKYLGWLLNSFASSSFVALFSSENILCPRCSKLFHGFPVAFFLPLHTLAILISMLN